MAAWRERLAERGCGHRAGSRLARRRPFHLFPGSGGEQRGVGFASHLAACRSRHKSQLIVNADVLRSLSRIYFHVYYESFTDSEGRERIFERSGTSVFRGFHPRNSPHFRASRPRNSPQIPAFPLEIFQKFRSKNPVNLPIFTVFYGESERTGPGRECLRARRGGLS